MTILYTRIKFGSNKYLLKKVKKFFYKAWSWLVQDRQRYERFLNFASRTQRLLLRRNKQLTRLPRPFNGWTKGRDLRPLAKTGFLRQQQKKH